MREPAPRFRQYEGRRTFDNGPGDVIVERVELDGERSALDPRHDLFNHSPCGFEWGYAGSGPAQLALALVADATGDDIVAVKVYQRFKSEIVAQWPQNAPWHLNAGDVADFARSLAAKDEEVG